MENQFPLPGPIPTVPEPTPPPIPSLESSPVPNPEEATPPPPGYQPPPATVAPEIKRSPFRLFVPIAIGLIVVGLIAYILFRIFAQAAPSEPLPASPDQTITLTYWGLWEPTTVMQPVIDAFEAQNPNIKIDYQLQSPSDYQDRLRVALEGSTSPDIVRLHTTWLPLFAQQLLPSPPNTMSATELNTNFYPIVGKLLIAGSQVYGVPLTAESLALYVNTAILQQNQLQPPKTWEDLLTVAKTVTERDPVSGKITRAGVALGNTTNVRHWPDIVSMMLLQAGVSLVDLTSPEVPITLTYYTDFVNKHNLWDETMPESIVAFANERVAMAIGTTWDARDIRAINPTLSWQTVPVPQLPDVDPVNWATIWFEGVSANSQHPLEAWKFITFLGSANAQQILFDSATADRGFPQPPANKAVAEIASRNQVIAPFVQSLETAGSFYTASMTQDSPTALNSRLIKYLEDAVNGISVNQETNRLVDTLSSGFTQVLSQYGLVASPPAVTP